MAFPLLSTKLYFPTTRPNLVARPHLIERLSTGLRGPLTLISAPAGYGKTTLLSEWRSRVGHDVPVAWLSLDAGDNDLNRFLQYLTAALETLKTGPLSSTTLLSNTLQPSPSEVFLTSLINEVNVFPSDFALILDDYHIITTQAIHEAIGFLLDRQPARMHLVILTRSDPPLPLARLRARGQTVELRAADLRFTEAEAAQFLNDVMGLHLNAGSVAALAERTEGWIAGLQMAALSMREREDVDSFIQAFAGTNRFIMDFMLEEVLAREPQEIQTFLLQTAILTRLTGPLCEAVTGASGGQEMLERLERRNLFVIPLDDDRRWYRYHHLLADLLRARLQKSFGDQGIARLHLHASEWYEQNDSILEAIHHASLASDFERIERLIEQNYIEMMNHGEMSWIRSWMGKLSRELIYRRPWLCLYEALNRSWFGQLEEANLLLSEAEKHIQSEVSEPGAQPMLGYHAYVKSRVTAMQGDTHRAIELCCIARENIPDNNLGLQIDVSITLGYEYFLYGDFVNANKILHEMIRSGYNARAINNPVAGYAVLARLHVYQGRLHDAYDLLQKAEQLIHEASGQYLGVIGLVDLGIAALLYEWNNVEAALVRLKQGLDFLPLWGKADDLCLAYTTLSRIQLAQGNRTDAAGAVEKAVQLIQTCGVFSEAHNAVETSQIKMWLVQGDWSSVDRWAATLEKRFGSQDPFRFEDELTHIAQARVFIAQNKLNEAIRLLSCLEDSARSGGRQGRLIEIIILKALALHRMGDTMQADTALTKSLALAEPEGYLRIFLDEGRLMQMLLAQWLAHANAGPLRDYAIHLLSRFDAEPHMITAAQEKVSPASNLVEPLSRRELQVLHLIALGRTNQEVARQLIVSPGTVKAHTASIYRKLDVANRTEAVARARQLGILF
jgi:LuxR family maltose regulon positive regulatory protein